MIYYYYTFDFTLNTNALSETFKKNHKPDVIC